VTSNPYSDSLAITVADSDFRTGSLQVTSFARPGKLFTANSSLMVAQVGSLKDEIVTRIVEAVIHLLQAGIRS
jgi:mRNA interferase MazF